MQYIEYCKINQNPNVFVIFPTKVKYICFGKKLSTKQKAKGQGTFFSKWIIYSLCIFVPNPIFPIGISSVALLVGGATWFCPPPPSDKVLVPGEVYDIFQGGEIIELLCPIRAPTFYTPSPPPAKKSPPLEFFTVNFFFGWGQSRLYYSALYFRKTVHMKAVFKIQSSRHKGLGKRGNSKMGEGVGVNLTIFFKTA